MKKTSVILVFAINFLILFYSCKKDISKDPSQKELISNTDEDYLLFGKAFANVLSIQEVRAVLKKKALEKFNGDFDVLYSSIKETTLEKGISLHSYLVSINPKIENIVKENPDLTIFIPTMRTFDPESWNTKNEIPILAIRSNEISESILAYDHFGKQSILNRFEEPEVPVIVLKRNERLELMSQQPTGLQKISSLKNSTSRESSTYSDNGGFVYDRILSAYIPNNLIYAWSNLGYSPRDFIYYDIDTTKNKLNGTLNTTHSEHIVGIQLNNEGVLKKIADWSEGDLEFKIDVKYIARDGQVKDLLSKGLFCNKNDLISVSPLPIRQPDGTSKIDTSYVVYGNFDPIEIATWDNYNMGNSWNFHLEEYDSGTETSTTRTIENTYTTKGTGSFEVSVIEIFKVGISGGTDVTEKNTSTVTTKSTDNSDNLYDGKLDFTSPILLGKSKKAYPNDTGYSRNYSGVYSINTGAVKLYVLPLEKGTKQRIFVPENR